MATEKKQSFFGGAAVLAAGVVIVKIIGALFKIPLANILSETGNADFNKAYNIHSSNDTGGSIYGLWKEQTCNDSSCGL